MELIKVFGPNREVLSGHSGNFHSDGLQNFHSDGLQNFHSDGLQNFHSNGLQNFQSDGNFHSDGLQNFHSDGLQNFHSDGLQNFHSDGLENFYFLKGNIWVIKSRCMRWTGHVARMGGIVHIQGLVENPKESSHLEDLGTDDSIWKRK